MPTDEDKFNALDVKHPDYKEYENEWVRCRDVVGDYLVDKEDYLPKGIEEPSDEYALRCKLSQWIPDSGLAVWKIVGALYKEPPKRDFKNQESEFEQFSGNADRKGHTWNSVIEDIAFNVLTYGAPRVLVNVPTIAAGLTRAEEKRQNIHPYIINYRPLSVIDWDVSDDGTILMVRIKEERFVRGKGEKKHLKQVKFIEYDQNSLKWWIFRKTDKDVWALYKSSGNDHKLGITPMICMPYREIKAMIGDPFIRYSSRADVQKHQAESDQAYDNYIHAHPHLGIWTNEDKNEVGIGTSKYLKLRPGTQGMEKEDAKYIGPPASAFEALRQFIQDKKAQIATHAKMDPMGVIQPGISAFQASGTARAWSFGTSEARVLSKFADYMEQVEAAVFELVIRYQTKNRTASISEKIFVGDVQYPEEYDLASTEALLEQRAQIAEQINSPTLLREIDKRIAASKVGDTSAQTLKKIHEEIENNPLINTTAGKSKDFFEPPKSGFPAEGGDEE